MKQDDIEKILQQYGEDKRQQQQIADNLHRMAQQQSRRRIGIVGVAVLLLCATLTIRHLPPQNNIEPTIASTHKIPVSKQDATLYNSIDNTPSESSSPTLRKPQVMKTATDISPFPTDDNMIADSRLPNDNRQPDVAPYPNGSTSFPVIDTPTPPANNENHSTERPNPLSELYAEQINTAPAPNKNNTTFLPEDNTHRISFISSINASTVANGSIGYAEGIGSNELALASGESFSSIDPNFSLSANIGASYAVASNRRSRLDIGLSLSGRAQQGTVNDYLVGSENSFVSTDNLLSIQPNGHRSYTSFDLFVNIPITLNFFPLGKDRTGWSVSVTPAHSIVRSHTLGASSAAAFVVNPWKLNVGLGIVLPRKVIRRVALTANLLPLYTSRSIHEIGFEIGF